MFLVVLTKLQKPINWAQVVFNNLHSRLQDLTTIIKRKKGRFWQRDIIQRNASARHHPSTLVFGQPKFPTTKIQRRK